MATLQLLPIMNSLLRFENCRLQFGGISAIEELSFSLSSGELTGLIGPNGAGKTSVFNLITGVYQPTSGRICFKDRPYKDQRPYHITAQGIARTFQNIRLFSSMTVLENVRTAFNLNLRRGFVGALLRGPIFRAQERRILQESRHLLEIFDLLPKANSPCLALSYGDQRRLEIARALATSPQLLLLDEPAAGMNPAEKHALMELIQHTQKAFDVTILLVEHDMSVIMGICRRILVMDRGRLIADGNPEAIRNHPAVIKAYLGTTR